MKHIRKKEITNSGYVFPVNAILILGPTGSGKTPLGEAVRARGILGKRAHHLDFGSELRSIASGIDAASYTVPERDFIVGVLERGLLLENEHFGLAAKIITGFLNRSRFCSGDVLILNGIPRHRGQAIDMEEIASVHAVVALNCSVESVVRRIEKNTGGDRTEREDDALLLIEKKLEIYRERTTPLIEHYRKTGSRIYEMSITETTTTGSAYSVLSSLAAGNPPVAFVAEPPQ